MKLETVVRCGKDKLVADGSHHSGFSFYSSFEGSSTSSTEITAVVWETSRSVSADSVKYTENSLVDYDIIFNKTRKFDELLLTIN
ncbi:hypothetical protein V1478_004566 [Vespula squamosa]|uniref:Uncharacterized protein n=1 Tax=Vespula squamosa TaxID=30214 RepID=A0ABD2BGJ5_VESSQ